MAVSIVSTWTGGYAPGGGFFLPRSPTAPTQVAVANVPGDWMIAVAAWLQPVTGAGVSMAVSDDARNWWEPAGGDSPAAGLVRCSVWAAPAARAAANVQAAPTGPATSNAVAVYDVAGIGPGWQPSLIASNDAASATSLTIGGATAGTQSLVITVFGANEAGATITSPAGWTALTGSTIVGISNAPASITVAAAYQVIAAGASIPAATWGVSGSAIALAGVTVAIPLAAAVPSLASPDWPAVITEAAIGSGPQSAPSGMTWTDMSPRSLALQVQQGRQYSLSQLQAAQGTITLDNPDGALIPPGGGWQVQFNGNGVTAFPKVESFNNTVPVTAGVTYSAAIWAGSSVTWASGMTLGIEWKTAGGTNISFTSVSSPPVGPVAQLLTVTGTAPATAAQADLFIGGNGTPASSVLFTAAGALPEATGSGVIMPPPATAWQPLDNATVTILAPWTAAYPGIDSGTPVRRRCYWPGGAWQVQFTGDGVTATPKVESSSNRVPVTAGAAYAAGAWLASSAAWAAGMQLGISWKNSGGGSISTVTKNFVPSGQPPALVTVSGTAPATAVTADIFIQANGTPPAATVFSASAAPPATTAGTGAIVTPPGVTWATLNNATATTLAPWQPDPRGAPSASPWSVPFSGFFRRWPFTAGTDLLRGSTVAEISDIWAYATGSLDSMAREEMLIDQPYALWPLDDAPSSPAGSNIAPGNSNPLNLITAKLGAGGATQQWGASSGALIGDTSAKVTQSGAAGGGSGVYQLTLAGTSLNTNGYGYSLLCTDPGFPPLSGPGVTVETWFSCASNTNLTGNGFGNSGNTITVTGSSFANGTPVVFTVVGGFMFPAGMTAGQVYYVIAQSGATFQISATPGGSAVTLTTNGSGLCATTTSWNPSVLALRNASGTVFSVNVGNSDGRLFISGHGVATTTIDTSRDWRQVGLIHLSVALTLTTWRVILDGGGIATYSGSMTSPAATWTELCLGGVMDRLSQGFAMPGQLALAAVYPYVLPPSRVVGHYWGAIAGMKADAAHDRADRVLSYAGLAGRRWIGQQGQLYEIDTTPSGQDIGGQSAATSAGNIAASTAPALLYVAPTGDITYQAKQYTWNQPAKWTLGDRTDLGEVPFQLAQFSTDYDPTRVYNNVQLTQLDTQTVTVPAGATASTTVAAMTAASQAQYGSQPYQQTAYLNNDYSAAYTAGSGLVDLAAWIAMIYGKPRNRVPAVTVNAAAYPAAWPLWLQASPGDMVAVNVRLPTAAASPIVSVIARVTQTHRSMQWTTDSPPVATIALTLDAAPEYQALTADDAVRGLLNGTNVLAW